MTELTLYFFAITLVLLGAVLGGMGGYFYAYYELVEVYRGETDEDEDDVLDEEEIA